MGKRIENFSNLMGKIRDYPELQSYLADGIEDKRLLSLSNLEDERLVLYCLYTRPAPSLICQYASCDVGIYDGKSVNEKLIGEFWDIWKNLDKLRGDRVRQPEFYNPSDAPKNLKLISREDNIVTVSARFDQYKSGRGLVYEIGLDLDSLTPFQEQKKLK